MTDLEVVENQFSAEEVKEILLLRGNIFDGTITNALCLQNMLFDENIQMPEMIFARGLYLVNTSIKGALLLDRSRFEIELDISGGEIYHLWLNDAVIKGRLSITGVSIPGEIHIERVSLDGPLIISPKLGPQRIFVSPDMAELVHWAAPTIPLVVVR